MTLITGCAWEGGSLRISLSVDSFIYFANIRPDYKWSYFANVIVYCYNRADKEDTAVVFWNYKTGDVRYINLLKWLPTAMKWMLTEIWLTFFRGNFISCLMFDEINLFIFTKVSKIFIPQDLRHTSFSLFMLKFRYSEEAIKIRNNLPLNFVITMFF